MSSEPRSVITHQSWCALARFGANEDCSCGASPSALSDGLRSERMPRHTLYMGVADLYSQRATCRRASVGAVAVRDGRIIAAGYNGAPAGLVHCLEEGCILVAGHCVRAVHAEANLVSWAARTGTALDQVEIYTTSQPCLACAKLLVNAGVVRVVFRDRYSGDRMDLIQDLGLKVEHISATEPAS